MYEYRVRKILRVVDGDTIDAEISLGFGLSANFRFRLQGIDTPEIYGAGATEQGKAAKAFVEKWFEGRFNHGGSVTVRTFKASDATLGIGDGAFGRWLGAFIAWPGEPGGEHYSDLSLDLINEGFAQ